MKSNYCIVLAAWLLLLVSTNTWSDDNWTFGVGTGISALDVSGDAGFNTQRLGPIDFDASLEPDEVQEYLETAYGFAVLAKRGDWAFSFTLANLELEENVSATQGANRGEIDLRFDTRVIELSGDYTFSESGNHRWGAIFGLRYTDQEYAADLFINGVEVFSGAVADDWTDALLGVSYTYGFSPTFSWSSRLDYGVGGSEGTAHFNTGLNKLMNKHWFVRFALAVKDTEYEEKDRGDTGWFLYDATETTLGASFLYLF